MKNEIITNKIVLMYIEVVNVSKGRSFTDLDEVELHC